MPKRYPPEEPREWLNRARSDLLLAKTKKEGIYLEDLCFQLLAVVKRIPELVEMVRWCRV